MNALLKDLRYACRILRQHPGFTLIAVITLALGIGVNAAVFSIVRALLLRPLPYKDSPRLVYVSEFWPHEPVVPGPVSPDFANWRREGHLFDAIEAYGGGATMNLTGGGSEPERIAGVTVTASFLDQMGIHLKLGRNFTREEDTAGGPGAVILSYSLWQRRFGANSNVLGTLVNLDNRSYTVVGVLPPSFVFPDNDFRADLLTPVALPPDPYWHDERSFRILRVLAHLKPGVTLPMLRAELSGIVHNHATEEPPQFVTMRKDMRVTVTALRDRLSGDIRPVLLILQGAVALVLLIGCLNIANLQIARSISRQREIAVRAALGAGGGRIMRQLLAESLLLSGLGGAAGLVLGYFGRNAVRPFLPTNLHLLATVQIDRTVLAFTFLLTVLTGILTGLAPVFAASKTDVNETLKAGGHGATVRHQRLRDALVVAEVAMAMVLLTASGLLIRTFLSLAADDPGFRSQGVLTLRISLPDRKYPNPQNRSAFFSQLLTRARAIPGVANAAISSGLPLIGTRSAVGTVIEGRPLPPPGGAPTLPLDSISADYFRSLGIPLIHGREFSETDREDSPLVVIVNEPFAETFFSGQDPIGKRIRFGSVRLSPWREIIGVVGNVEYRRRRPADSFKNYDPYMYAPYRQWSEPEMLLVLKSGLPSHGLINAATGAVHAIDRDLPVFDIATMEERLADSLSSQRASMLLMGVFAALALTLAVIGIFGVISYLVSCRSHEIGIRMALGARPVDVLGLVLRHGLLLTTAGIAAGLGGAVFASRVLRGLLYGVTPGDPLTLGAACLLFAAIAAAASYIPARRAAALDPMDTLRHE